MNDSKIISESALLRTLTGKSVLWFGKYNGVKVQQIIDLQNPGYLRWIYYNYNGITFTEDVLKEITITGNRKIKKPGIAPEMNGEVFNENVNGLDFCSQRHISRILKIRAICRFRKVCNSVNITKSQLQAINHGRI